MWFHLVWYKLEFYHNDTDGRRRIDPILEAATQWFVYILRELYQRRAVIRFLSFSAVSNSVIPPTKGSRTGGAQLIYHVHNTTGSTGRPLYNL
jgi:hypothetical protein